jgi:hypothetical protein
MIITKIHPSPHDPDHKNGRGRSPFPFFEKYEYIRFHLDVNKKHRIPIPSLSQTLSFPARQSALERNLGYRCGKGENGMAPTKRDFQRVAKPGEKR